MLLGSLRYDTTTQSFKMAGNFEPAAKFFTSHGRLEKQKQQNEYSNKGKKHINRINYISMNIDEHLSDFLRRIISNLFVMQQIFQLSYFSFIAAIMIFDRFPKFG